MRKSKPLLWCTGGKKHGCHTGGLPHTNRGYVIPDELNRVVDGQTRRNRSSRAIDVKWNVALRILCFQEQRLRRHQIGNVVVDGSAYKNDAVFEQSRIDVVGALATIGLLDDHWDQRISFGIHQNSLSLDYIFEPVHQSVKPEHELFPEATLM